MTTKSIKKTAPKKRAVTRNKPPKKPVTTLQNPELEIQPGTEEQIIAQGMAVEINLKFLQSTVFPELNLEEIQVALLKAKAIGANVFGGELKAYKKDGSIIYQVARDFLKNKAWENPEFSSFTGAAVYEHDTFEMGNGTDAYVKHVIKNAFDKTKRGKVIGAWCVGKAKDGTSVPYLAEMSKYCPEKIEGTWWADKPDDAILRVAEAVVLKKFAKLVGVYSEEELAHVLASTKIPPKGSRRPTGKAVKPDISQMSALDPK